MALVPCRHGSALALAVAEEHLAAGATPAAVAGLGMRAHCNAGGTQDCLPRETAIRHLHQASTTHACLYSFSQPSEPACAPQAAQLRGVPLSAAPAACLLPPELPLGAPLLPPLGALPQPLGALLPLGLPAPAGAGAGCASSSGRSSSSRAFLTMLNTLIISADGCRVPQCFCRIHRDIWRSSTGSLIVQRLPSVLPMPPTSARNSLARRAAGSVPWPPSPNTTFSRG